MLRRTTLIATLLATVLAIATAAPATAAPPTWAPADQATIHPGVQTVTDGAQCTANFVFHDGTDVYIGQAAHCSGTGGSTETNGCDSGSLPLGTPVDIDGASRPGTMVYNSWIEMQSNGGASADACNYNDFALVKIDPADHDKVNPSIPSIGGPVALGGATSFGETVYTYGNSSLRLGISNLSAKQGTSLGTSGGGWTHSVYTVSPGIPGDSGSAFLDADGQAIGVLSTLQIAPVAGSNGVSDLSRALAYLAANTSLDVALAPGTEPFTGTSGVIGGLLGG